MLVLLKMYEISDSELSIYPKSLDNIENIDLTSNEWDEIDTLTTSHTIQYLDELFKDPKDYLDFLRSNISKALIELEIEFVTYEEEELNFEDFEEDDSSSDEESISDWEIENDDDEDSFEDSEDEWFY